MLIGSPFFKRNLTNGLRFYGGGSGGGIKRTFVSMENTQVKNTSQDWIVEFLGTSSAAATKTRNVSSLVLKMPGFCIMFDCGEGTVRQMLSSTLSPHDIDAVFITHLHCDHFYGLPGLSTSLQGRSSRVPLFSPQGLSNFFVVQKILSSFIYRPISGCDFKNSPQLLFENEKITVKCIPIRHTVFTLGFVIEEKFIRGSFRCDYLKEKGIYPGPIYKKFENGQNHQLDDGSIILSKDVFNPGKMGRKIVVLGDTYDPSAIESLAMDADILVHEATCSDDTKSIAIERGHSTARMAGQFGKKIRAKKLILNHFSPRNFNLSSPFKSPQSKGLVEEAMDGMETTKEGIVIAANDFMRISI